MEIQRKIEIIDSQGNTWVCSIFQNESYKDAPAFIRISCRDINFDKILESLNNQFTLIKVLKFITYFHYIATPEERDPLKLENDAIMAMSEEWIAKNHREINELNI